MGAQVVLKMAYGAKIPSIYEGAGADQQGNCKK